MNLDVEKESVNAMNIQVMGICDVGVRGMTVSFFAHNCALRVVNDVNKHRNMQISGFETKYSSEYQKIHSSLSSTSSALDQENTVGIIGGLSVLSTLIFLEKIVWWSSKDGGNSVPFIVCSNSMPRQTISSSDSYDSRVDQIRVVDSLRNQRLFLEEGGARCIVMPCHLSHVWHGEISQGCKLPFLHVADCVARELKQASFKPLEAGSGVKIGVLTTTDGTLVSRLYQEKLQNKGFEVVLPDKAAMEHIIYPTIKSLNRRDKEGALNLLRIAIQVLLVKAANVVILASDELQGLLPHDDPLSKKCIDPMDSLARSVVKWSKSVEVHNKNRNDSCKP